MATAHSIQPGVPTPPQKLGSWKCIAGYFGCDERTARRWERERGLPVHRVPGKRSAVFAYSSELEMWLSNGEQEPDSLGTTNREVNSDRGDLSVDIESGLAAGSQPALSPSLARSGAVRTSRRWTVPVAATVAVVLLAAAMLPVRWDRGAPLAGTSGVRAAQDPLRHLPAPNAEGLYLRGRYFWNLRTADSLSKAIDAYTQAIVKDPSYAEAYAGLAESYDLLPQFADGDMAEDFARAKSAADRAIKLDPNVAAAHNAKAFALFFWDWDIPGSDAEFRRALALDPNSAQTHQWYASTLLNRLEGAECMRQIDEALRLNPTSAAIATDAALMHAEFENDPASAIRKLQDLEQTQPTLLTPPYFLRELYFALGDYPAYITELHHVASISHSPDDIALADAAERGWARAGKTGMLEDILKVRRMAFERGREPGYWLGQTYLLLGRPMEGLPYFRTSLDRRFILLISMQDCDWAKKLEADPGYAQLFAQIRDRMHGGEPAHPAVVPLSYRLPQAIVHTSGPDSSTH
jgi:cytochrome c-type biogenesis protein CcmH/NrfG